MAASEPLHRPAAQGPADRPSRLRSRTARRRRRSTQNGQTFQTSRRGRGEDGRPAQPDLRPLRSAGRAPLDGVARGEVPRLRRAAGRDRPDARAGRGRARLGARPRVRGTATHAHVPEPVRSAPVDLWTDGATADAHHHPLGAHRRRSRRRGDVSPRDPTTELPRQRRGRARAGERLQPGWHALEARSRERCSACRPGSPGALAAIILSPGSAAPDRDETVAGVPLFAQLAGALADAGCVVSATTARVGQSGGRDESATLFDYGKTCAPPSSSCRTPQGRRQEPHRHRRPWRWRRRRARRSPAREEDRRASRSSPRPGRAAPSWSSNSSSSSSSARRRPRPSSATRNRAPEEGSTRRC